MFIPWRVGCKLVNTHNSVGIEEGTSSLNYLETESWRWIRLALIYRHPLQILLHVYRNMHLRSCPFLFSVRWVFVYIYMHTCCHVYVHKLISANQTKRACLDLPVHLRLNMSGYIWTRMRVFVENTPPHLYAYTQTCTAGHKHCQ